MKKSEFCFIIFYFEKKMLEKIRKMSEKRAKYGQKCPFFCKKYEKNRRFLSKNRLKIGVFE